MSTPFNPSLHEDDVPAEPFALFAQWYQIAVDAALPEPSAMTLATATLEGIPSARIVLLRGFDERGFTFYTNYDSRKAAELAANPRAALVALWTPLQRQVRIEGDVEKVSADESDAYFHSRPFGHQLGALTSSQSTIIPSRAILEERLAQLEIQYAPGAIVPRPTNWGGYRVIPHTIEFWQGRPNRLHDRLRYCRHGVSWKIDRLSP